MYGATTIGSSAVSSQTSSIKIYIVKVLDSFKALELSSAIGQYLVGVADKLKAIDTTSSSFTMVVNEVITLANEAGGLFKYSITSVRDSITQSDTVGALSSLITSVSDSITQADTVATVRTVLIAVSDKLSLIRDSAMAIMVAYVKPRILSIKAAMTPKSLLSSSNVNAPKILNN